MSNVNVINESEQPLSQEQLLDRPVESIDGITPLAPECFSLVGGGSGMLLD
jgi:hypothetical protein